VVQLCLLLLKVQARICSKAGPGYNAADAITDVVLLQKKEIKYAAAAADASPGHVWGALLTVQLLL
jgi:hypothetical protein